MAHVSATPHREAARAFVHARDEYTRTGMALHALVTLPLAERTPDYAGRLAAAQRAHADAANALERSREAVHEAQAPLTTAQREVTRTGIEAVRASSRPGRGKKARERAKAAKAAEKALHAQYMADYRPNGLRLRGISTEASGRPVLEHHDIVELRSGKRARVLRVTGEHVQVEVIGLGNMPTTTWERREDVALASKAADRGWPREERARRNSTGADAAVSEYRPGRWFYRIEEPPRRGRYDVWGPFSTYDAAVAHMSRWYANPGGWSVHRYDGQDVPDPRDAQPPHERIRTRWGWTNGRRNPG